MHCNIMLILLLHIVNKRLLIKSLWLCFWIYIPKTITITYNFEHLVFSSHLYCQVLTSVSASKNTHFLYCVRVQQWSLVKVTPSSGRRSQVRWALSLLSNTSITTTSSNTSSRANLGKCIKINEAKKSKTIQDRWEATENKINVALKTTADLQAHGKV